MVESISLRLATILSTFTGDEEKEEYIHYGLQIILGGFIKFLLLTIISLLSGIFIPMMIVLATFSIFRCLTGGFHFSTYLRCLIAGLLLFPILTYLVNYIMPTFDERTIQFILNGSLAFGLIIIYFYSPTPSVSANLSKERTKKLKYYSLILVFLWAVAMKVLVGMQQLDVVVLSLVGYVFQMTTLMPISITLINKLEKILDRGGFSNEKTTQVDL